MEQSLVIGLAIVFAISWIFTECFCGAACGIIAAKALRKRLGR